MQILDLSNSDWDQDLQLAGQLADFTEVQWWVGGTEQFENIHHFNNNHSLPSSEKSHIPGVVGAALCGAELTNSFWQYKEYEELLITGAVKI